MGTQAEDPAKVVVELTNFSISQLAPDCIIPIDEDGMVSEVNVPAVPSELTDALDSSNINPLHLQGTARALWTISFLTLVLVISTALYQPAAGALFGRIKILYYITLAIIFLSGVAEAITAVGLSCGRNDIRRRFNFGRVVLCFSVVPLIAILGIGGSRFIKG